jgi:hypothetical protein
LESSPVFGVVVDVELVGVEVDVDVVFPVVVVDVVELVGVSGVSGVVGLSGVGPDRPLLSNPFGAAVTSYSRLPSVRICGITRIQDSN